MTLSFFRRLSGARRKLRLDLKLLRGVTFNERIDWCFRQTEQGRVRQPTALLLRVTMFAALMDRSLGLHYFWDSDDDLLRALMCLAVPRDPGEFVTPSTLVNDEGPWTSESGGEVPFLQPDPENPDHTRVWYEIVPPPVEIADELFRQLRWHAGMKHNQADGRLILFYEGLERSADVVAPTSDDFRIFFTPERPPIRPKLGRHFEELHLSTPR